MLSEQRTKAILQALEELRTASVSQLCSLTGASEATIRRDLNALAQQGKLNKVRGGATVIETTEEVFGKAPESMTAAPLCRWWSISRPLRRCL